MNDNKSKFIGRLSGEPYDKKTFQVRFNAQVSLLDLLNLSPSGHGAGSIGR